MLVFSVVHDLDLNWTKSNLTEEYNYKQVQTVYLYSYTYMYNSKTENHSYNEKVAQ